MIKIHKQIALLLSSVFLAFTITNSFPIHAANKSGEIEDTELTDVATTTYAALVGIPATGHNHADCMNIIANYVGPCGYSTVIRTSGISRSLLLTYLSAASYGFFLSRSHGSYAYIGIPTNPTIQYTYLMDDNGDVLNSNDLSSYSLTNQDS